MLLYTIASVLLALYHASAIATDSSSSGTILETRITTLVMSEAYPSYPYHARQVTSVSKPGLAPEATQSIPSSLSIDPSSRVDTIDACWEPAGRRCAMFVNFLAFCYGMIGGVQDPNDRYKGARYQDCLCKGNGAKYKLPAFSLCLPCLQGAMVDSTILGIARGSLVNYCDTSAPSVYLFLYNMIDFLHQAKAPPNWLEAFGPIPEITKLASSFTMVADLNAPLSAGQAIPWVGTRPSPPWQTSTSPSSSSPNLGRVTTATPSLSSGLSLALPTENTSDPSSSSSPGQLPRNWPLTTYGVARRPGQSTTFPLTNPENGEMTAIIIASLPWYPRPLGLQRPLKFSTTLQAADINTASQALPSTMPTGPQLTLSPSPTPTVDSRTIGKITTPPTIRQSALPGAGSSRRPQQEKRLFTDDEVDDEVDDYMDD